ncbi:MAG TPA: oxidoreductase [Solibacterales bacterium]|nr:oxidoreductase [Bryobacterales bacterium]
MPRTAMIAGATGLVGGHCLRLLARTPEYSRIVALVRRETPLPACVEQRVVDFGRLSEADLEEGADVFCALGTTIRKAGSQAAFRRVDLDYPQTLAQCAAARGSRRFLAVSSVGADAGSNNFYLRTKGEMERAVTAAGLEATHFFRPSFLIGERIEDRWGERIGIAAARAFGFLFVGGLKRYRAVTAETVAAAMVRSALSGERGVHVHHYRDMAAR